MSSQHDLIAALGITSGDLVALVGGGGKSSLLFALERGWPGPVLLTTTTRIGVEQMGLARAAVTLAQLAERPSLLADRLAAGSCLVVGELAGDKALGTPPAWAARWLARPDVDLVIVEADGARGRPVKAPANHEPVIPPGTTRLVVMAGIDALAGPIAQVAHRPELVARLTGLAPTERLTPAALAMLLTHERGGLKGAPPDAAIVIALNKVATAVERAQASAVARQIKAAGQPARVVLLQLQPHLQIDAVLD